MYSTQRCMKLVISCEYINNGLNWLFRHFHASTSMLCLAFIEVLVLQTRYMRLYYNIFDTKCSPLAKLRYFYYAFLMVSEQRQDYVSYLIIPTWHQWCISAQMKSTHSCVAPRGMFWIIQQGIRVVGPCFIWRLRKNIQLCIFRCAFVLGKRQYQCQGVMFLFWSL